MIDIVFTIQMIGRAGRNGAPSQAHLLFKANDMNSVDVHLKSVCTDKENCRRSIILSGVGNNDCMHSATNCCDVCSWGNIPYSRLDVLQCTSRPRTKKSCQLRELDNHMKEQVKKALLEEREKIIQENPGYMMMGKNYVYSDYLLDTIVEKSDSIKSQEDLQHLFLHPEYCNRVFRKFWTLFVQHHQQANVESDFVYYEYFCIVLYICTNINHTPICSMLIFMTHH